MQPQQIPPEGGIVDHLGDMIHLIDGLEKPLGLKRQLIARLREMPLCLRKTATSDNAVLC
jgi:hypothetical protein